jgi:Ni/Co efflux regulator RcnB
MRKILLGLVATAAVAAPVAMAAAPANAATTAQRQAIGSAHDYLRFSAFSKQGLIDQLDSKYGEGFSKPVATYAVNHIRVSWNKQAVRSAKSYLKIMHFSRAGLIDQLESPYGERFTHSQAVYGVNHVGL